MRIAAVDIGTNSVLLLVAERTPDGELRALEERATITRLGQGVDRTRALASDAVARTNACLDDYARAVARYGVERTGVVGTSALRDARGNDAVRKHVASSLGVELRVISGEEEARLTFAGALSGLGDQATRGEVAVFDIGGGSTEVVFGRREAHRAPILHFSTSVDVGSVRLTERHAPSDPPTQQELTRISQDAEAAFAGLPHAPTRAGQSNPEPVGIAGTVTTLAAVSLGLVPYDGARVHGQIMTVDDLNRVVGRLAAAPLAVRRQIPGLEPGRADVIVAGGLITLALLRQLGATSMRVSDRGVRWGLAAELAG